MSNPERWRNFCPLPADIRENLKALGSLFAETDVQLAYLFGSLSRWEEGQDVDLAILAEEMPVYQLRAVITACLKTERLDLVDLKQASPFLRFEIISTGTLIYAVSEAVENAFELQTIQLYRDTVPMRRQQNHYLQKRMALWSSTQKPLLND